MRREEMRLEEILRWALQRPKAVPQTALARVLACPRSPEPTKREERR
jgi:hypothetical protein